MSTAAERDAAERVILRSEAERQRAIAADRAALVGRIAAAMPAALAPEIADGAVVVTTWHGARWRIRVELA